MVDVGDEVTFTAAPRDDLGEPFDPSGLEVSITLPDGTSFTDDPTHPGAGSYAYVYVTEQVGRHVARWVADDWAYTDILNVWPADPRFLISLSDARRSLGWSATDTSNDDDLRLYIAATTEVIEDIVGPVVPASVTETFDGGESAYLLRDMNVIVDEVTVVDAVNDPLVEGDDYTVKASAGIVYAGTAQNCGRFATGTANVSITYTTGLAAVPPNIILAAREQLRFLWQIGRQGNRPSFGDAPEAEYDQSLGYAVPRRVIELCGKYRRKAQTPASV